LEKVLNNFIKILNVFIQRNKKMLGNGFKQRGLVILFGQEEMSRKLSKRCNQIKIAKQLLIKFCRTCSDRFKQLRLGQKKEIAKQPCLLYCNGFTPLQISGLRLGQKNRESINFDIKKIII
jgi:hypothetical protein